MAGIATSFLTRQFFITAEGRAGARSIKQSHPNGAIWLQSFTSYASITHDRNAL
jgi:hypothetical protein